MAIYFPPLFCGKGTMLKVRENFEIEFDGFMLKLSIGDKCIVKEIIGYGYDIKPEKSDKIFRIMNSSMSNYFDIIEKVGPESVLNNFEYKLDDGNVVKFKKAFEIKNVVQVSKGQQFLHFKDTKENRTYHDLFSLDGRSKVMRMNNIEFEEY